MTLRNGKAIAKEGVVDASSAVVVETAMSITAESPSVSGTDDMEVDEESRATPVVNLSIHGV
jgi:hypothetical protein